MPTTFNDFEPKASFASTDTIVGFDTVAPNGEKKWLYSTLVNAVSTTFFKSGNTTYLEYLHVRGAITETKAEPTISGGTLTLNLAAATFFVVNLNAVISTITLQNIPSSPKVYSFTLQLTFPDNTIRTVEWPDDFKWSGGTIPTPTSATGKRDTFTLVTHDGGANWYAFVSDQNQ
jgi:hypothetical protein